MQRQYEEEQGTNSESNNTTLQVMRLDTEGLIPRFEKDVHQYYLTVSNDIQDIEVLAMSENPKATVEITGNTNLQEGLNLITIQVISEDKTQSNHYTIEVTKTSNIEMANTNLEILAIENVLLNPPFDSHETNYNVEVSNTTESINLFAIPENEQAVMQVMGTNRLVEGNNLITVMVTAPNGFTKKTYQVEVYKRNLEEEQKYQQEQKLQEEKLEEAYKISELSTDIKENQEKMETEENKQNQNLVIGIVITVVGIGIFILLVLYMKRKKLH